MVLNVNCASSLGWYVYMESSNQLSGRAATIQTVLLTPTRTQGNKLCLSFFYHMYGHTMGDFSVHVDVPTDSLSTRHFHLTGNQKQNDWQKGRFAFDTPKKPFKVRYIVRDLSDGGYCILSQIHVLL